MATAITNGAKYFSNDTISSLTFNKDSYLIITSWTGEVELLKLHENEQIDCLQKKSHDTPALCSTWNEDGTKVFSGACDLNLKMWDLQSNQFFDVAHHDAAIKTTHWVERPNYSCLMTGSWDKTIKLWDLRQSQPITTINLPDKCYCADVYGSMAVVSGANRFVQVLNLDTYEIKTIQSPLKYQHRCVRIFRNKNDEPIGFAIGSIEGRVAIVNTVDSSADFSFKCHRDTQQPINIFAINDMVFHPIHMTLATVGSDGQFNFWDKDKKTKINTPHLNDVLPISCCAINRNKFVYAHGYDWHKGHEFNDPNTKASIHLYDGDVMRKQITK